MIIHFTKNTVFFVQISQIFTMKGIGPNSCNAHSSKCSLEWVTNQKWREKNQVDDLRLCNTGVKHEDINLTLENGDHTLIFEGIGKSDGLGISIANVVLRRRD